MLDAWSGVLGAIVDGARPWSTPAEIASAVESDCDHVYEVLFELECNGLVDAWELTAGPAYTLSALAAEGLRVHIVAYGLNDRLKWSHLPERRHRASRVRPTEEDALAGAVDPRPGPAEAAEASDEVENWRPRGPVRARDLPEPTVLLTGCASGAWAEDNATPYRRTLPRPPRGPCPVCRGNPLRLCEYCLRCHRWGFDRVVAALARKAAALAARDAG